MNPSKSNQPLNTLDEIVKKLQWAAVGKSEAPNESDDIDNYVSNLIIEEAKRSNKLYDKFGPQVYLDPTTGSVPCQLKKTNKVFLNNIMKNTNSHNRYISKALGPLARTPLSSKAYKKRRNCKSDEAKPRQSDDEFISKTSYPKVDYKYKDKSYEFYSRK